MTFLCQSSHSKVVVDVVDLDFFAEVFFVPKLLELVSVVIWDSINHFLVLVGKIDGEPREPFAWEAL